MTEPLSETEKALNLAEMLQNTDAAIALMRSASIDVPAEGVEMRTIIRRAIAAESERDRLREAIWPGLPAWKPTPESPQQDFYEAVAESLRAQSKAFPALHVAVKHICRGGDISRTGVCYGCLTKHDLPEGSVCPSENCPRRLYRKALSEAEAVA